MLARAVALVVVLLVAAPACSGSNDSAGAGSPTSATVASTAAPGTTPTTRPSTGSATSRDAVPAPAPGADPYLPPDPLPAGEAGELIWAEPLPDAPPGAVAWRVLYHSRSADGTDVAVSGLVAAPAGPAPEGGRPVVSWAHGTTGIADGCAPSREGLRLVPLVEELVADGYVVVATDYEGLGTPGVHPYLVGPSEAHGVLDAARVAAELPTGASDRTLLWGYSQGGHAAMWAAQLAPAYAPDLDVLGVVGGAPPSSFGSAAGFVENPLVAGFAVMIGYAWGATYPGADFEALLTPEAQAALPAVEQGCVVDAITTYAGVAPVFVSDPFTTEPWPDLFAANSLGGLPVEIPVLLAQGSADALVPLASTEAYAGLLCAGGTDVQLLTLEGADHTQAYFDHTAAAKAWLDARVARSPTTPTC